MQQAHSSGKLCHYLLNSTMNVNSKVKQIFFCAHEHGSFQRSVDCKKRYGNNFYSIIRS